MVKFWNSCISEWEGWLTLHKEGGSRPFMTMTMTIWWPRSGVWIYQIVTGVTSVVGVPSTHLVITRDSEAIMFSPWVFVCVCLSVSLSVCLCLSRCLSRRFNYEGLVPHKPYIAGTLLGLSSCASYVSRMVGDDIRFHILVTDDTERTSILKTDNMEWLLFILSIQSVYSCTAFFLLYSRYM